jgi:hypothetical protein
MKDDLPHSRENSEVRTGNAENEIQITRTATKEDIWHSKIAAYGFPYLYFSGYGRTINRGNSICNLFI